MRTVLLLLGVMLVSASALPAREQRQFGWFAPVWGGGDADYSDESGEDSAAAYDGPAGDSYSSVASMLRGMQTMMTRMRQQLEESMNRFPPTPDFRFPMQPPLPVIPFKPSEVGFESKPTNSSSITKVVNGHKVTVNESTYESKDGGVSSVYRIKVVDVRPHSSEEESGEELKPEVQPEDVGVEQVKREHTTPVSLEVSDPPAAAENEIPERRGGRTLRAELLPAPSPFLLPPASRDEAPAWGAAWPSALSPLQARFNGPLKSLYPRLLAHPDAETLPGDLINPIDLSGDLKVNQLLSEKVDAGGLVMPDPDSEFVELVDGKIIPSIQAAS